MEIVWVGEQVGIHFQIGDMWLEVPSSCREIVKIKLAGVTRRGSVKRRGEGGVGFSRYLCLKILRVRGKIDVQFQIGNRQRNPNFPSLHYHFPFPPYPI